MKHQSLKYFLFSFFLLAATVCRAHESRPILVDIQETSPLQYFVQVKIPATMPHFAVPNLSFPDGCKIQGMPALQRTGGSYLRQSKILCTNSLSGQTMSLDFPAFNPSLTTLFRIDLLNGQKHSHLLKPGENLWTVPKKESKWGITKDYTWLGIRHIWEGIDHLLFVACLIFIAGSFRRILITITGFTVAHSITLVLSALEVFSVPVPPVEAAIALSIVFLATEIVRGNKKSLTYKYPATVSVTFGLLHGFGFAAVLREIGLPQTELATSLLFFNVGVEMGQILFVLGLAGLFVGIKRVVRYGDYQRFKVPIGYIVGTVACFWFNVRVSSFWT